MDDAWSPVTIASVVEGHGEVSALPKLLHRIAAELEVPLLTPKPPLRLPKSKLVAPQGIEDAVSAKASEVTAIGGILVLTDADDDCPAEFGPELLARARLARPDRRIAVVLANREFEAWFLAAAKSLAGKHGFPDPFPAPADPEAPRDCKGLLTRARARNFSYKETVDQTPLTSSFDMQMARGNSPSFDKFYRDVAWLLGAVLAGEGDPDQVVAARGLAVVSDEAALNAAIDEAIAAKPDVAAKVRAGKIAAVGPLVGAVMTATGGQADAARVRQLILDRLSQ